MPGEQSVYHSPPKPNGLLMKKTLYVSDLDGTLLQPGGVLSDFARNTLNQLIEAGLLFTIATGRQLLSVQEVLQGLRLRLPVVEKDGAFVSDLHSGKHYWRQDIKPETAVGVLEAIFAAGLFPFINTYDGQRNRLCYQIIGDEGTQWYLDVRQSFCDPRLAQTNLAQTIRNEHTVGFIVIGSEARLIPLLDSVLTTFPGQLSGYVQPYHASPGYHWLVVHHEAAQKDRGISKMRQMTGLEEVELVVFGDQANDLPMIQAADRGYAMENGDTTVKNIAQAIIGPNSSDSVVKFIREDWKR